MILPTSKLNPSSSTRIEYNNNTKESETLSVLLFYNNNTKNAIAICVNHTVLEERRDKTYMFSVRATSSFKRSPIAVSSFGM